MPVEVVTAASGTYETTLMAEMGKSDAPTLFQVNGPVGLANWKDYCYDLAGSDIYSQLTSDTYALKEGDVVYGIGYVIESYGIITNKTLLAEAGYTVEDIQSFEDLKAVAEDITARKNELGFSAFTSAGMDGSSDWRFKTHLANLPIYYEYKADGIGSTDAIKGTYLDNYKQIWDLYITDSTCDPTLLASKTGNDAVAEFVGKKAVFYQNGTWAYNDVKDLGDDNLGMLPIYIGVDGMLAGENTLIAILSIAIGAILGELLQLDEHMHQLGDWVERKFGGKGSKTSLSEGFVTASLLFCVGAMAIMGALDSGLTGDHSTLYAKALLDGIISVVYASTLGVGVALSAIPIFLYQGAIALGASFLAPYLTEAVILEMKCVGSILILGLSLNMLGLTKLKVMNYVPAVFLPILLCRFL